MPPSITTGNDKAAKIPGHAGSQRRPFRFPYFCVFASLRDSSLLIWLRSTRFLRQMGWNLHRLDLITIAPVSPRGSHRGFPDIRARTKQEKAMATVTRNQAEATFGGA